MEAGAGVSGAAARTTVRVAVAPAYDVVVGAGVLDDLSGWITEPSVALISDHTVAELHAGRVAQALEAAGLRVCRYTVAPGEVSKSLKVVESLHRSLASDRMDRGSAVLALGGGVVSDLAGFVAATFMRGIAFYVAPTTTLAMVDASVGGKTGVNLPEGKNLVGAFWQPKAVVADVHTLRTLPPRLFRLGAVEAYKHGLLADPSLLRLPDERDFAPDGPGDVLVDRIARSVRVKAAVVAADEHEHGVRAHLNLGHTLGHALEAASGHALPHGDAVAYGLLFAAWLGRARGHADWVDDGRRLLRWLRPDPLPDLEFDALVPYLQRDKKNRAGRMRFVLLEEVGRPRIEEDVTFEEQRAAWVALRSETEDWT